MRKSLVSLLFFCVALTLGGCNPALRANFSADVSEGNAPLTVTFTDLSGEGTEITVLTWLWDFGDPDSGGANVSTEQNPFHTYDVAGTYTVRLDVTAAMDQTATLSKIDYIVVSEAPVSILTNRVSGAAPVAIVFTESTSASLPEILSRVWDFGDPDSGNDNTGTDARVLHEYVEPGEYTATLTLTTVDKEVFNADVEITVEEADGTIISEETVIVELELSLEFVSLTENTLVFMHTGPDPHPFEIGSIVVGTEEGGYLRLVTGITDDAGQLTLDTEMASLADTIIEGGFEVTGGFTTEDFLKAGFKATTKGDFVLIDLNGTVLLDESGLKVTLEKAELTLNPSFSAMADWSILTGVKSISAELTGTVVGEIVVVATAGGAITRKGARPIGPTVSRPFLVNVGPLPIIGTAQVELIVAYEATITAQTVFRAGYKITVSAQLGLTYTRGADPAWTPTSAFPIETTPIFDEPDSAVKVTLKVSLGPELKIQFYKVLAPSLSIGPYVQGEVSIVPHPTVITLGAGIDASIGFKIGLFINDDETDPLLVDQTLPVEIPSIDLFKYAASDMDLSANSVRLIEELPEAVLTIENITDGLPAGTKALFEMYEPLSWKATSSDPRIVVTPTTFTGNGTVAGDRTTVTISMDPDDAAALSEETDLKVTFENVNDLLDRDDFVVAVSVGEIMVPIETIFGVWENDRRSDHDVGGVYTYTIGDGTFSLKTDLFVLDDSEEPPVHHMYSKSYGGTYRLQDYDLMHDGYGVPADWVIFIESITDCVDPYDVEPNHRDYCDDLAEYYPGTVLTASSFYNADEDTLFFEAISGFETDKYHRISK